MDTITLVVEFSITPGNDKQFKTLMRQAVEATQQKDLGALGYQLYFNHDESKCYSIEVYRDSEAVLRHLDTVSEIARPLFEICATTRFEIFGSPSAELLKEFEASAPKIYSHWDGYTR
jgi:quinol monooxygenase YgiN